MNASAVRNHSGLATLGGTDATSSGAAVATTHRRSGSRAAIVVASLVYALLLHWVYATIIAPAFAYASYYYAPPPLRWQLLAFALAVTPSMWLPKRLHRPSQAVYVFLYISVIVPGALLPFYSLSRAAPASVVVFSATLVALFGLLGTIYLAPLARIPRVDSEGALFGVMFTGSIVLSIVAVTQVFGVRLALPSFSEVYAVRAAFRRSGAGLIVYLVIWSANVLNPLLIGYGFVRKRRPLIVVGVVSQLLLYSITGFKSALLILPLLTLLLIGSRRGDEWRRLSFASLGGVSILIVAATLFDKATRGIQATSLLVRRFLVTPGLLTGIYFEFFSNHPKTLFAHGILGEYVRSAYDAGPAFIIGRAYFHNAETSANAHIWADAFANLGYGGMIITTLLLAFALWIYDSLADGRNKRLAIAMIAAPAVALANTSLPTTLLTHGLFLAIVMMYLMPAEPERTRDAAVPQTDA